MFNKNLVEKLAKLPTPFYYYDVEVLRETLKRAKAEADKYGFVLHYALKANANARIVTEIKKMAIGADCVSGNEVERAIECGIDPKHVVFAGVGKTDREINYAIDHDIFSINCESLQELEVVNELAAAKGKTVPIGIRINPNVDAKTHANITTGLKENKFGINFSDFEKVFELLKKLTNLKLISFHFHIGSQITEMGPFEELCDKVNFVQDWFEKNNIQIEHINVGGGLGINYKEPLTDKYPKFAEYFATFNKRLKIRAGQKVHFELGRSLVAQCGTLVTKVLYVKNGIEKNFAVVDAGMTDLIRPALYQAYHKIENISSELPAVKYDVVGPICESTDTFDKDVALGETKRGDLLALYSAGAYGEIMASRYNLRHLPGAYYSDEM